MKKELPKYKAEDGEHKGEVIVSWIITHGCPENCGYCISPCKKNEITSEAEHLALQNWLIKTGVTKLRYIGGEPMTIPHLPKLIEEAHKCGTDNRLSTNGLLLTEEKFEQMKDNLNSVALPYESRDDVLNEKIRGSKHHSSVIESKIKMIKEKSNLGLVINTCVHKENIDHLEELGAFLNEVKVDHWKLRRFVSTSGRGAVVNKARFDITDEQFFAKIDKLKKMYPNLKIDGRMPSKLTTRLMVSPQGDLYRMIGDESQDICYGNVLKDKLNIKEIYDRDGCN